MSGGSFNNNMQGVLFKNDKGDNPNRADYRGQCEINGVKYWLDAWINTSKDHRKFMSIKFKPQGAPAQAPAAPAPFDDEIPF